MDERYEFCPICFVELRLRVDGRIPLHSHLRCSVVALKGQPPEYCPGSDTPIRLPTSASGDPK